MTNVTSLFWSLREHDINIPIPFDEALLKMKDDGRLAELQKKWLGQAMDTPRGDFEPNI